MVRLIVLAVAGSLWMVPAAASARTTVTGAYAYFKADPGPGVAGRVYFEFRTDQALAEDSHGQITTPSDLQFINKVSPELHCYEAFDEVASGRKVFGHPGDHLRVRLGKNASIMRLSLIHI